MADPRFFRKQGPFTLERLAEITGARLSEGADPEKEMTDVAPLGAAGPDEVSFLDNRKYREEFRSSGAGASFVDPKLAGEAPEGMALLLTEKPYHAYALAAQAFYPRDIGEERIDPGAAVDGTAELGPGCVVERGAVIGPRARLGARCYVGVNAVIGEAVEIGDDADIGPLASLSHCLVGDRVEVLPGARIGQKGFGFALDPAGHVVVPQLGRVIVGDDVSIGANACIDRGTGPDTVIGSGTIIDNLVQIGHNVRVGERCVLIAQVGIAGSTKLGDNVVLAGQVGVAGHLTVGAGSQIGAQAGVMKDVPPGSKLVGGPAIPVREFMRQVATLARLSKEKK